MNYLVFNLYSKHQYFNTMVMNLFIMSRYCSGKIKLYSTTQKLILIILASFVVKPC